MPFLLLKQTRTDDSDAKYYMILLLISQNIAFVVIAKPVWVIVLSENDSQISFKNGRRQAIFLKKNKRQN